MNEWCLWRILVVLDVVASSWSYDHNLGAWCPIMTMILQLAIARGEMLRGLLLVHFATSSLHTCMRAACQTHALAHTGTPQLQPRSAEKGGLNLF